MTLAIKAHGTLLQIGDGGSPTETFTTIAEVTEISGPSLEQEPLDVTSHESSGGFREFVGGLIDGGEVTLSLNYIPTDATQNATTGLIADLKNMVVRNFQLVFPDVGSTTWSFPALVMSFEPTEPVDDKLGADVTLKVAGEPTLV